MKSLLTLFVPHVNGGMLVFAVLTVVIGLHRPYPSSMPISQSQCHHSQRIQFAWQGCDYYLSLPFQRFSSSALCLASAEPDHAAVAKTEACSQLSSQKGLFVVDRR